MQVLIQDQHHEHVTAFYADYAPGEDDWKVFLLLAHLIETGQADHNQPGDGLARAKELVGAGEYPQGYAASDTLALKALSLWFDFLAHENA